MKKMFVVLAGLMLVSASAFADKLYTDDGYLYTGFGFSDARVSGTTVQTKNSVAVDANLGMKYNKYFGIEASTAVAYGVVPSYKTNAGNNVNGLSVSLDAVGYLPISDLHSIYVKAGYTIPWDSISGFNNSGVNFGAGFDLHLHSNPKNAIRFGFDRLPAGMGASDVKLTNIYFMLVNQL